MLADSKVTTTFWAEAVNTACYVKNRIFVTKPHNKTPNELSLGRKPALGFMRPFRCFVTILNTIDHLGKFDGKVDEGFFVGYLINSKAFRIFNNRTRIVEDNLHVQFSENTPNIAGSGPNWLFDIDALTKSMNYKPTITGNQSNGNAGDDEKKVTEEPGKKGGDSSKDSESNDQEVEDNVNSTNTVNASSINEVNVIGVKTSIELPDDPNMLELEDIVYLDDDEDVGAEADMNNLDAFMPVSHIPTTRIHKDHPVEQIIKDLNSTPQTRRMTKNLEEHEEPKKVIHALKDPSRIETMQEELLQFKLQEVWTLLELPNGKGLLGLNGFSRIKRMIEELIEAIRLFLAYASFKDFVVFHMDVKSAFLYVLLIQDSKHQPMENSKALLKDEDGKEVKIPRKPKGFTSFMRKKCIFRLLHNAQPKLGIWYPKDSPFDLVAYTDSDYAGASLDRKSTIGDLLTKAFDNGIEVNAGDSKLMLLGINLLLLGKVNAARHKLTRLQVEINALRA
ncbi:putative ribonuclease H-like domain-containing protein [Tanacetum coccineum]